MEQVEIGNLVFSKLEEGVVMVDSETSRTIVSKDEWINLIALMSEYGLSIANTVLAKNFHEGNIHSIGLFDCKAKEEVTEEHY